MSLAAMLRIARLATRDAETIRRDARPAHRNLRHSPRDLQQDFPAGGDRRQKKGSIIEEGKKPRMGVEQLPNSGDLRTFSAVSGVDRGAIGDSIPDAERLTAALLKINREAGWM